MSDLSTRYLGMDLKSPLVASPSPICARLDAIRALEDAGAAAVVLHSLFEEQINIESQELDRHLSEGSESFAEAVDYFPEVDDYRLGPEQYLEHIRAAKAAVDIPIIASLNGVTDGGWVRYAKYMEEAGADALELNAYYIPTDPEISGAFVEQRYCDLVHAVDSAVDIPLAVKIGPYFSNTANMAQRLEESGANALVLFNRFYQPDFDLESLEVVPNLRLSTSDELRLRLRWVAILHGRVESDFAVTGGVHTHLDVLKCMMAGANVAMMTSALLHHGIDYLIRVHDDLRSWMEEHEYESIEMMQGSMSQRSAKEPGAFERANYLHVLGSFTERATLR